MSLADKLTELFEKPAASLSIDSRNQPISSELQLAAAALLLEAAYGDEEFHKSEKEVIKSGLQAEFGLSSGEVKNLMNMANEHRMQTGDITPFLKQVAAEYSTQQKESLLELIKKVVEADGRVLLIESVMYDFAREQLGLNIAEPEAVEVPD
jgi:uncharacterized tellurite resistance protein B-like protein